MNMIKLLKRTLCFVIAVLIALPLCGVSAADNTQKDIEVENAMEILRLLGLMEDYYDYNTNIENHVVHKRDNIVSSYLHPDPVLHTESC